MGFRRFGHFGQRLPGARTFTTSRRGERVPPLDTYADEPLYDLTMVADLLGVRRMTLWAWVQQLRIPQRISSDSSPARPRFSERDLVALHWLRDQILSGASPFEAAAHLIPSLESSRSASPPGATHGLAAPTPALSWEASAPSAPGGSIPDPISTSPGHPVPSQETNRRPLAPYPVGTPITPPPWLVSVGPPGAGVEATPQVDMAPLVVQLLRAFAALDANAASAVADQALGVYPIEEVCTELFLPALARVAELNAHREAPLAETLFAQNYVRAQLFGHFVSAIERQDYPLVFLGCAPKEDDEIPALLLGVFWRRLGLRVVYLGRDVNASRLVGEFAIHRPALLALTVSQTQRVRTLSRLAREVAEVVDPTVLFGFYGHVFAQNPELRSRVVSLGALYLGDDPVQATRAVRSYLLSPTAMPRL